MACEAASLGVASALHLPNRAGIAEAIIGVALAAGAIAMIRVPARARTVGIVLNTLAIAGFINGLTMTARAGDAPAIAYHAVVLPILIASVVVLARGPGHGWAGEDGNGPPPIIQQAPGSPEHTLPSGSGHAMLGLRRANHAAFILLLVQYGIGMGVNLYVTVPSADHSIGDAISSGPAALSIHVVLGVLLVLAAIGLLIQSVIAGDKILMATALAGLVAMIAAAAAGSSYVDGRHAAASMAMATFTGIGLLAYGANLHLLASRTRPDGS